MPAAQLQSGMEEQAQDSAEVQGGPLMRVDLTHLACKQCSQASQPAQLMLSLYTAIGTHTRAQSLATAGPARCLRPWHALSRVGPPLPCPFRTRSGLTGVELVLHEEDLGHHEAHSLKGFGGQHARNADDTQVDLPQAGQGSAEGDQGQGGHQAHRQGLQPRDKEDQHGHNGGEGLQHRRKVCENIWRKKENVTSRGCQPVESSWRWNKQDLEVQQWPARDFGQLGTDAIILRASTTLIAEGPVHGKSYLLESPESHCCSALSSSLCVFCGEFGRSLRGSARSHGCMWLRLCAWWLSANRKGSGRRWQQGSAGEGELCMCRLGCHTAQGAPG